MEAVALMMHLGMVEVEETCLWWTRTMQTYSLQPKGK